MKEHSVGRLYTVKREGRKVMSTKWWAGTGSLTIPDRCAHWSGTVPPPFMLLVALFNSSESGYTVD